MRKTITKHWLLATVALTLPLSALQAASSAPPSSEEMWQIIMEQRAVIQQQNARIEKLEKRTAENEQAVAATADAVEQVADSSSSGSGGKSWADRTQIGGYAELHYNNLTGHGGASDKDEVDLHRFVLFFGHEFTDRIRFFSEIEIEHALSGDGKPGEVEVEQAWLDFDLTENHTARAGVFLIPVGILNEEHEPDIFYGVERNPVEKNIVPTTWWEAGAGLYGEFTPGFSYDGYFSSGLDVDPDKNYAVRSGRQKVALANANAGAFTGRLRWTGTPGLRLSGTAQYQIDMLQGQGTNSDPGMKVPGYLFEADLTYQNGPFGLRALAARWHLDGSGPESVGADVQQGWYIEPSWRFNEQVGVFARYDYWNNRAGKGNFDSGMQQWNVGVNYWPAKHVVLKADYQNQIAEGDKGVNGGLGSQDGFNLGLGLSYY